MATPLSKSSSRNPRTQSRPKQNSPVSSNLANAELKHRVFGALTKLSDRDTHQIGVEDLEKIIRLLAPESFPVVLNALLHDSSTVPPAAKREYLRLLAFLATSHPESASPHLSKFVGHVVRRIKDSSSDTSIRDSCRETIGMLSSLYLGNADPAIEGYSSVVALFVKPLFETMGEQNKGVQAGAAMCLAKVVECAAGEGTDEVRANGVGLAFQKLLPRICKLLAGQNFLSKGALLSVVSSLSQVGAITPQGMQPLLQTIRECMESSDWATRKAAADSLSVLASSSSHLVGEECTSTLTAIEACRFDKIKPVRDSMTEALVLWKRIGGKEDEIFSESKRSCGADNKNVNTPDPMEKLDNRSSNSISDQAPKRSSPVSSPSASVTEAESTNLPEKAVVKLKKRVPSLSDKDLNPEFFQKLTRNADDLQVEVVLPRKKPSSLQEEGEEELKGEKLHDGACNDLTVGHGLDNADGNNTQKKTGAYSKFQGLELSRDKWAEQQIFKRRDSKMKALESDNNISEIGHKDLSLRGGTFRSDVQSESSIMNNKGSWLTIQRQLSQLERQQTNLMNMLQEFMGGSHDSMIMLENRVRGLEWVVEEMARELAISGRRNTSMMMGFDGSPSRSSNKFTGFSDYSSSKFERAEGRMSFTERYLTSDGRVSGTRGRDPNRRSDSEAWDSYPYAQRNGHQISRRGVAGSPSDGRLSRIEHNTDQVGNRRGWEKGPGPFRFDEGPSARSVWQASKDEATLEAIRVAGDDSGTQRAAQKKAIPELDGEALTEDNGGHERGPLWASWTHAMDSLHVGDADSAYAEILSTGDDLLLVKLMDKSGPVVDQLSGEIANEVLRAVAQFLLEQPLQDIALSWMQQLTELVFENGPDFLGIFIDTKKEVLLSLQDTSTTEPPEDWEGATAEQMMMQLASSWDIDIQHLLK